MTAARGSRAIESSLVCLDRLTSGDWLLSVHLSDRDRRSGLFTEEAATAEIAAQLACRLRLPTDESPAVFLRRSVPEFDFRTNAILELVQSSIFDQAMQATVAACHAKGAELVICDDFLQLRNATSLVSLYGGALLPAVSSSETFMTIIESAEGIGLRCPRERDLRRAVNAAATSLCYDLCTSGELDVEWAQPFVDETATFIAAFVGPS